MQNVISEGAGGDMVTQFKSIIYYHEDKPRWYETVKVSHRIIKTSYQCMKIDPCLLRFSGTVGFLSTCLGLLYEDLLLI